jgi:hypothetical protein
MFGHATESGTLARLHAQCGESVVHLNTTASSYMLPYTGLQAVDNRLCGLVAMFHVALSPHNRPFFLYFFASAGSISLVQATEAARKTPSPFLGNPIPFIVGMLSQVMTLGATLPLYWLIFILSGAHSRKGDARSGARVLKTHAEAINLSMLIGVFIPTALLFLLDNPYVTALWQPFPLYMYIVQLVYLRLRPFSPGSGYRIIQGIHISNFVISAVAHHLFIVSPVMNGDESVFAELKRLFVPSIDVLDPATVTLEQGVMDVFKWDFVLSVVSGILATLWFARNWTELLGILGWYVMISMSLGPGAAAAGVIAWRESQLNTEHEAKVVEKQE